MNSKKWKNHKNKALELYKLIPFDDSEIEDDFFNDLISNNIGNKHDINVLEQKKIDTPSTEQKIAFMKNLICAFKRKYGENDNDSYQNYICSNSTDGSSFVFVTVKLVKGGNDIKNIYQINYNSLDRDHSYLNIWCISLERRGIFYRVYDFCDGSLRDNVGLIIGLSVILYLFIFIILYLLNIERLMGNPLAIILILIAAFISTVYIQHKKKIDPYDVEIKSIEEHLYFAWIETDQQNFQKCINLFCRYEADVIPKFQASGANPLED